MNQENSTLNSYTASDYDFIQVSPDALATTHFPDTESDIVLIKPSLLEQIAKQTFERLSFTFVKSHLENIISACLSPRASENDRFVCSCLLKNAAVSAKGVYPLCQDTGIATIFGWQENGFCIGKGISASKALSNGAATVYRERSLRFSTTCPTSFFTEKDPHTNMPAQVTVFSDESACAPLPHFPIQNSLPALKLIFCAKGGGSSNKTTFIQGTKATLNKTAFTSLIKKEIEHLGTSGCPPYTIAVVAGGLSPEQNLLTLKLATCGAYEKMTYEPNEAGFRDKELESFVMETAHQTGFGAQFGGEAFILDAFVIRLPRHGASCPISVGVSCSAHRNLKVIITNNGYYIEKTVTNPESLPNFEKAVSLSNKTESALPAAVTIETNNGIAQVLKQLAGSKPGMRFFLSGPILVARDAAHARWRSLLDEGKPLPDYCTKYPICYAGPAETPAGSVIGSFGPTTAGRMDEYAELLMSRGAALVTIAKGNRSTTWTSACAKYGAYYLGTPGGIAALIASEYITDQKILDYRDLGMEAVRLVTVHNLPIFVITTSSGDDFYERIRKQ